jgi:hypothetical protein
MTLSAGAAICGESRHGALRAGFVMPSIRRNRLLVQQWTPSIRASTGQPEKKRPESAGLESAGVESAGFARRHRLACSIDARHDCMKRGRARYHPAALSGGSGCTKFVQLTIAAALTRQEPRSQLS